MQKRTIKRGQAVADLISINLLEVMAMVTTAFVMIDMRGDRPGRKGEAVLMRVDDEAAVAWVIRYVGIKQARAEALMRMKGALEAR